MISYSQNWEDVVLWRAFKDVDSGHYIDIGAQDPIEDSVTKWFYDQGWRGVNVEPMPQYFQKIQKERSEDLNLNVAVSAFNGETEFYSVENSGLSTTIQIYGENAELLGFEVKKITVKTIDSRELIHQIPYKTIHFMKIDVEGSENEIIQNFDFEQLAPWVLVIEAHKPGTQIPDFQQWEPKLLEANYTYVFQDGVNRYYLHKNHSDLEKHFKYPVNIFDNYKHFRMVQLEQTLIEMKSTLDRLENEVAGNQTRNFKNFRISSLFKK